WHGRSFHGHFTHLPDPFLKVNQRRFVFTVSQLRTGHGHFNKYLVNIPTAEVTSEECPCGAARQTPDHPLYDYINFNVQRQTLVANCSSTHSNMQLHHINLLYNSKIVGHLEVFLK